MKIIQKKILLIMYTIFILFSTNANEIDEVLLSALNNSLTITIYIVDTYGDHIPIAQGTVSEFDSYYISIIDDNTDKIEIHRDDIVYIITNEHSHDSFVTYFQDGYGFQQELIDDTIDEFIFSGESTVDPLPQEYIPQELHIINLLNLIYEKSNKIVVIGFDNTISIATLAYGVVSSIDDETLYVLNEENNKDIKNHYTDILYIEIESLNNPMLYYKVIINSDLSITY